MTIPPGHLDLPRDLQSLSLCTSVWFPEGKWAWPTWHYCINISWGNEIKCLFTPDRASKVRVHQSPTWRTCEFIALVKGDFQEHECFPETVVSPQSSMLSRPHANSIMESTFTSPSTSYALQRLPRALTHMGGQEGIMATSHVRVLWPFSPLPSRVLSSLLTLQYT